MKDTSVLLTDLYQLTMLQGYFEQSMDKVAVFEFFIRRLPPNRNFLVAAGLEQVVAYLEKVTFSTEDLDYLSSTGFFHHRFLQSLENFRFTGDVHGMEEGTVFFPHEPILRVTAPLPQAQLIETRLINILQFQTMIASKAARVRLAGRDKVLVDFGLRRAHGEEAGLLAARASYLGGLDGTSTVLAGKLFDVPIYGTMAHSFVQAHDSETQAFEHFATSQVDNIVLLIDTYDTEKGAEKVVALAPFLAEKNISIKGVRLDSGDLTLLAKKVREILDSGGLKAVQIFASSNLDEYAIEKILTAGAPIDGFGIGTRMITSADYPYLDCSYKLVEYAGIGRRKRSSQKETWPGRKQVFRRFDQKGFAQDDCLTLASDCLEGTPLVQQVMAEGHRLNPSPPLTELRERTLKHLAQLPPSLRVMEKSGDYPVEISSALRAMTREVDQHLTR